MPSPELIESLAFVGLALAFELAERVSPARRVSRRASLATDLAGWRAPLASWPFAVKALLGLGVIDLAQYGLHRAMHASPVLWRAHAFHHTPDAVHWLSGFRTSAIHAALFALPQTLVPYALLGLSPYEASAGYAIGALLQLWTHANVRVGPPAVERALERVLVTPRYHRAHHSRRVEHQRRNLAMIFPLWDHLFGTWVDPEAAAGDALGIDEPRAGGVPAARRWLGL